jgi:hypothetical protein
VHQVSLVAALGRQAQALGNHPADTVHRPGRPGEGNHGGVGGHDVFVGDPKSLALGCDPAQLRRPLACKAFLEGIFGIRIARVRGEKPGDAYVEGLPGTHQQVGFCSLQILLSFS